VCEFSGSSRISALVSRLPEESRPGDEISRISRLIGLIYINWSGS